MCGQSQPSRSIDPAGSTSRTPTAPALPI